MSDSYAITSANLYENSLLVSSVISGNPQSLGSIVTASVTANSSPVVEDYADITQEAINAYQSEVNKGTYAPELITNKYNVYNNILAGKSSSSLQIGTAISPELLIKSLS